MDRQVTLAARGAGLTRDRIVTSALELLDEFGYEGLTTRRLAERLGVKSPALYWHFRNKRELADAVAAAMLSPRDWPGPDTPGLSPETWLAGRARALRRSLLAHRDGAAIHAGTTPDPELLPDLNRLISALVDHGLSPGDALRTLLAISRFTVGWVLEEQAQAQRGNAGAAAPDPASAPTLAHAWTVIGQLEPDADFDFGLRALIVGAMQHRRVGSTG